MINKYKEIDDLYDISRMVYTENLLNAEEVLISSFIEFKQIIDKNVISTTRYDVERFFDYMIFDYVFLSKPLESKLFISNKYITLDIYPNYQIFVYKFSDIEIENKLETRKNFMDFINNNKLSIQELKIFLLHLYGTIYPIYFNKKVSIRNEFEIFNKYISIEEYDIYKHLSEMDSNNTSIDNIIVIHESKPSKNNILEDKLIIKIKDIS